MSSLQRTINERHIRPQNVYTGYASLFVRLSSICNFLVLVLLNLVKRTLKLIKTVIVMLVGLMYSCDARTPCFKQNTDAHGFYYEQPDPQKYIHCDNFGVCNLKECGQTLVWSQTVHVCVYPVWRRQHSSTTCGRVTSHVRCQRVDSVRCDSTYSRCLFPAWTVIPGFNTFSKFSIMLLLPQLTHYDVTVMVNRFNNVYIYFILIKPVWIQNTIFHFSIKHAQYFEWLLIQKRYWLWQQRNALEI